MDIKRIHKLAESLRKFEESEMSLGTMKTLKMIDDEATDKAKLIESLQEEVRDLKAQVQEFKEAFLVDKEEDKIE